MFNQPLTALPLLGLAAALAWTLTQPGLAPAAAALACALALVWAQRHAAERQRDALGTRVAALEQRCSSQEVALAHAEAARGAAEAELRAAEQRYVLAVRGSQDGLWEWDLASDAVQLSPRWKSMLGFEAHEIADDRAGWLARLHPDDRAGFEEALVRHLATPSGRFDRGVRLLHKNGSVRHVLSRGVAIHDEGGRPRRMVGLDTDITEVQRVRAVLDAVAEGTAGTQGPGFFAALVRHFARALDVDRAFITECADHPTTRVRTLAAWSADRGDRPNFEYALEGTPCAEVVGESRACFHREGLQARFPREKGYESFLGLPIVASDGRLLGHLAFFDRRPRGDDMLVDSVYRIFLARAAAEMERLEVLARLAPAT